MILEIRTYKSKPGRRADFIALFRDTLAPLQAKAGIQTSDIASDIADPDLFVWTRTFADETARGAATALLAQDEHWQETLQSRALPLLDTATVVTVHRAVGLPLR